MDNFRKLQTSLNQIAFPDGCIEQVQLVGNRALLVFRDWQGQVWHLQFEGVVYFQSHEFSGDISEVQVSSDNALLEKAVAAIEQDGGRREGYPGLTGVTFLGEHPLVMLVCQSLAVTQPHEVR